MSYIFCDYVLTFNDNTLRSPDFPSGSASGRCACPGNFTSCGGRCLVRLDEWRVNYTQAESLCAELGAHPAVPRSEAEHQCAYQKSRPLVSWLGFNDVITKGQFIGVDGCGVVPSDDQGWANNNPNMNVEGRSHGAMLTGATSTRPGWHNIEPTKLYTPLCQLSFCHCP